MFYFDRRPPPASDRILCRADMRQLSSLSQDAETCSLVYDPGDCTAEFQPRCLVAIAPSVTFTSVPSERDGALSSAIMLHICGILFLSRQTIIIGNALANTHMYTRLKQLSSLWSRNISIWTETRWTEQVEVGEHSFPCVQLPFLSS